MPYQFKSRATADLIMLDASARQLLALVGKPPDRPGILTAAQIPAALAALEQAVREDEALRAAATASEAGRTEDAGDGGDDAPDRERVTLRQRAVPFIEMLRRSVAEGRDVTW